MITKLTRYLFYLIIPYLGLNVKVFLYFRGRTCYLTADINIDNLTIKINKFYFLGIMAISLTNTVFSARCTDWIRSTISYRMVRFVFHGYRFIALCSALAYKIRRTERSLSSL
jgi:hypothetical protein